MASGRVHMLFSSAFKSVRESKANSKPFPQAPPLPWSITLRASGCRNSRWGSTRSLLTCSLQNYSPDQQWSTINKLSGKLCTGLSLTGRIKARGSEAKDLDHELIYST